MYVFGGSSGGALEDFHQLDLETSTWSIVPTFTPRSPGVSHLLDRNSEEANNADLFTRNWNFYPTRDDLGVSNYRSFRREMEGNNFDFNDDFENGIQTHGSSTFTLVSQPLLSPGNRYCHIAGYEEHFVICHNFFLIFIATYNVFITLTSQLSHFLILILITILILISISNFVIS